MKRRAKIRLTPSVLARALDLPSGVVPVAVDAHNDPFSVDLIVEGPDLPEVPPDAESPFVQIQLLPVQKVEVLIVWPETEQTCPGGC